jgi:hypothetical protein
VGIGLTPVGSWGTQALMFAKSGASNPTYPFIASTESQSLNIGSNSYWDGANWKAQFGGGGVTAMRQSVNYNAIAWFTAPAVTTGVTQTFTQAMTLDNSGNLLIGQTSPNSIANGIGLYNQNTLASPIWWNYIGGNSSSGSVFGFSLYSTAASVYRFQVAYNGTISATTTSIAAISDETLKTNIKKLETGLSEIMQLNPRRFDWKNGDGKNIAGFIAQEVEKVLPELVMDYVYSKNDDGSEVIKKSLKMGDILPTLVNAVQEQQAIINELKAKMTAIENAYLKGIIK